MESFVNKLTLDNLMVIVAIVSFLLYFLEFFSATANVSHRLGSPLLCFALFVLSACRAGSDCFVLSTLVCGGR